MSLTNFDAVHVLDKLLDKPMPMPMLITQKKSVKAIFNYLASKYKYFVYAGHPSTEKRIRYAINYAKKHDPNSRRYATLIRNHHNPA